MLMKLFNKLQSNVNEVKEEYDIDTNINISCKNSIWTIEINKEHFTNKNLEHILKEAIDYFSLSNFRSMEEKEWY